MPAYDEAGSRGDSRRSLLGRLRGRRELEPDQFDDEPDDESTTSIRARPRRRHRIGRTRAGGRVGQAPSGARDPGGGAVSSAAMGRRRESARDAGPREPRHVRAVPTSVENKTAAAVSLFNGSEHPKTVAGIARSLGLPDVAVYPKDPTASVVNLVVVLGAVLVPVPGRARPMRSRTCASPTGLRARRAVGGRPRDQRLRRRPRPTRARRLRPGVTAETAGSPLPAGDPRRRRLPWQSRAGGDRCGRVGARRDDRRRAR